MKRSTDPQSPSPKSLVEVNPKRRQEMFILTASDICCILKQQLPFPVKYNRSEWQFRLQEISARDGIMEAVEMRENYVAEYRLIQFYH